MLPKLGRVALSLNRAATAPKAESSLKLEDGRVIIVPLKYFPDIQKLTVEKRKKYTIVDDRTVLFSYSDLVYHLEDFMGLENKWKER